MVLEPQFVTYLRLLFGLFHVTFPYRKILYISGPCHLTCPYMKSLCFFGRFVEKVIVSCFSDSLVKQILKNQMAAAMIQVILSVYTNYSKNSFFVSANTYEKYNVNQEHCIACHDDKVYFLPNCRYHNILIGDIRELLEKMDAICFNNQHVDCLYTLYKYRFSGKIVVRSGQLLDNVQRVVQFNNHDKGVDRMRTIVKTRL